MPVMTVAICCALALLILTLPANAAVENNKPDDKITIKKRVCRYFMNVLPGQI
jgi:hypothetical protein